LELARQADEPALEVQQRVQRALAARIAMGTAGSALIAKSSAASFAPAAAKTLVPLGVAAAMVGAGWFTLGPASSDEQSVPAHAAQSRSANVASSPSGAPAPTPIAAPPSVVLPSAEGRPLPESVAATSAPPSGRPRALASARRIESTAPTPGAELPGERKTPPRALSEGGVTSSLSRATEPLAAPEKASVDVAAPSAPLSERPTAVRRAQDPLLAETEALRAAQRALRNGDATRALELLHEQERTYAAGSLHEERAAARILALCQAGLAEAARASTERFVQRWPRSALRARVISACRAPSGKSK
jgi:hypothetical protein